MKLKDCRDAPHALIVMHDPLRNETHCFAGIAHESDKPAHSRILGRGGQPLRYAQAPFGFDLRKG